MLVTWIAAAKEKAGGAATAKKGKLGKKVNLKNLGGLRPRVLRHDRRRPAAGAMSRYSGNEEEDKNFAETILATRSDVESGASLADAMKKHPRRSTRCSPTGSRPAKPAASSTPF